MQSSSSRARRWESSEAERRSDAIIDVAVRAAAPRLQSFVDALDQVPELGFFETATADLLCRQLEAAALKPAVGFGRTGVIADLDGAADGPTVAVIGELDAMPATVEVDGTAASHTCGHHLQLGILAGVATALRPLAGQLAGRVRFMGVPAEEFVDLGRRMSLRAAGELVHLSGKAEILRLGGFDDVDIALLVHATTRAEEGDLAIGGSTNAMLAKIVEYEGKAAHAGAPYRGVNALTSAIVGLNAVNAIRDTFRDEDHVRVHGIVTSGGTAVNVVPDDVRLEIYIRAASRLAMEDAERKVDRALWSGAVAVGGAVRIRTLPGYLPLRQEPGLAEVAWRAAARVVPADRLRHGVDRAGSTDMGDISHLMPALQLWAGGVSGELHADTFRLADFDVAVVAPARVLARMVVDLLSSKAEAADQVLLGFRPEMSPSTYLAYLRDADRDERFDGAAVHASPVADPPGRPEEDSGKPGLE
jgi:amidohydrolase